MDVDSSRFLFLPLGGVGKIGMNVALYHIHGQWIMIDLGAGFADGRVTPGVDMVVADLSFIRKRRKNLLGIVLTHAHEDHIGAIPYLWDGLQCPVYATKFTAAFLRAKLAQFSLDVPIKEVDPEAGLELGPFSLEFVHMTHSIPEMHSIAIHTDVGTALHTGDWKLDASPVVGPVSDTDKLQRLGDDGLLAVVSDSTNIFTKGRSGSEGSLYETLLEIVQGSENRVAVSLFASNIARISTLSKVAEACGRRVAILGRSLLRAVQAAKDSGYLGDIQDFVDVEQASGLPRHEVFYLCTGCQGEPLAATAKLASNSNPMAALESGDTVIFSSKIIPGNERRIFDVFNGFVRMGIKVVTEFTDKVHVSGHPSRDEVCTLYSLTRPQLCVPVHGEYMHMYEHAKLAKECGIPSCVLPGPGDVVDLATGEKLDSVKSGILGIDGAFLRHPEGNVMSMRRKMKDGGIIVVTLLMNKKQQLLRDPMIIAPGVLDESEDEAVLSEMARRISAGLYGKRPKQLRSYVRGLVFGVLRGDLKNRPLIEVQVGYV